MLSIKAKHQQGAKASCGPRRAVRIRGLRLRRGREGRRWGRAVSKPAAGASVMDVPVLGPIEGTGLCCSLGQDSPAQGGRFGAYPGPEHPLPAAGSQTHPILPSEVL